MQQNMEAEKPHWQKSMWPFVMMFTICAIIQFDAVVTLIPNQIAAMCVTPVVWGIGAIYILIITKKEKCRNNSL